MNTYTENLVEKLEENFFQKNQKTILSTARFDFAWKREDFFDSKIITAFFSEFPESKAVVTYDILENFNYSLENTPKVVRAIEISDEVLKEIMLEKMSIEIY